MSTSTTEVASKRQTWALFCATKLDVRELGLTYAEAHNYLDRFNKGESEAVVSELQARGATGKGNTVAKPKGEHAALWQRAQEAGVKAAQACTPEPMHIVQRKNPVDDSSPIVKAYAPVMAGVCGFAWVNVKPGNSSFARWLKLNGHARKDSYYGGVSAWIHDYEQSYERKMAHAAAVAKVLREAGIKAHASGRLD